MTSDFTRIQSLKRENADLRSVIGTLMLQKRDLLEVLDRIDPKAASELVRKFERKFGDEQD